MYGNKHPFLQLAISNHPCSCIKSIIHGVKGMRSGRCHGVRGLISFADHTPFSIAGRVFQGFSCQLISQIYTSCIQRDKYPSHQAQERKTDNAQKKGNQSHFDHFQDKCIQLFQGKLVTLFYVLSRYFLRFTLLGPKINTNIQNADAYQINKYKKGNRDPLVSKEQRQTSHQKSKQCDVLSVVKRKKDIFYKLDGGHVQQLCLLIYFFSLYAQKDKFSTPRGFTYA